MFGEITSFNIGPGDMFMAASAPFMLVSSNAEV